MQTYSTEALERGLKLTLMQRQIAAPAELVAKLCEVVPSEGEDEKHEWLGDPPQMAEHKTQGTGPRKITALTGTGYTITNKVYDASMKFGRDALRRNRSGSFQKAIGRMADVAMHFPNKRVTELMTSGTSDTCYDGTAYFGNSHTARKDEGSAQDNLLAGTGTSTAQIATDIATAVAYFNGVIAENGEPFFGDMELDILFVAPPALEKNFREALEALIISNTTNVFAGIGELYINTRLTADANDWYAYVTNPGWRPFIWQPETSLEVDVVGEGSEQWKTERTAEFIVSQALGAGYGFWQSGCKVVNA
jgi:phage major head subunit gpT-like protein